MEGSSVVLHCDVDSNPTPTITWFFGDTELMTEVASNSSLPLDNLSPEQDGVCGGPHRKRAMLLPAPGDELRESRVIPKGRKRRRGSG